MRFATRALAAALPLGVALSCGDTSSAPPSTTTPLETVTCDPTAQGMTAFAASDVAVSFEAGSDAGLAIVSADVGSYLGKLWGGTFAVSAAAPDFSKRLTLWFSTSAAAATKAGLAKSSTYAITRTDGASGTVVTVAAHDASGLTFGAYALLEELGARFFHPKQDLVPSFGSPHVPAKLSIARTAAMASRGLQLHTLHPIEYMPAFNQASAENLADAKRVIDWLVKTGQNYVQWPLLATVDWPSFAAQTTALLAYAHLRGVRVGAVVQMWGGSSLQNNFVLVSDMTSWKSEMHGQLDKLLTLDWDQVELALGEFLATPAQTTIDWLNEATSYVIAAHPKVEVSVQNHVGNYSELYVPYDGKTVFYYHLPQYADARLGQSVHTLSVFDVYRGWATYAHPNFWLQHDYITQELPVRRVKYFPESAYWISADIDVPLFLPMTLTARWNDIHYLYDEATKRGLALEGHVQFSSGHEWGFWLTDYLTAKMLWQPDASLSTLTADFARAFGSCGSDVARELDQLINVQNDYLFDKRLLAYVQGENATVDLGNLLQHETHPNRVPFETVLAMKEGDRVTFETTIVDQLDAMVRELVPIEAAFAARCRGGGPTLAPWCNELWDGTAAVRNRAEHAALLYRAILAKARGGDPQPYVSMASNVAAEAGTIIAHREPYYRFDLQRLTGVYENPTSYDFGVLRPSHTLCYWARAELQVTTLLESGYPASIGQLPACTDDGPM